MIDVKWLIGLIAVAGALSGIAADEDDNRESAKRVEELAGRYDFYADAGLKTKFERHPEPLLKYTNPVRGEVYGNVFVWTHQGRPEVIGAVFDYRSEGTLYSELHTLASPGVVGRRDGKEFWKPPAAGATFKPVPGAPVPAETDKGRSLQMRELSRGFSVERDHPEHKKEALRLLAQPLFRYASPKTDTLDGAIFAFVDATTDPEAYLLLEASGGDKPAWRFAFARVNIVEFRAEYKGEAVWGVKPVKWDAVYERHEPYAIVHEKSRRGLERKP
jgi:hypothetical protein